MPSTTLTEPLPLVPAGAERLRSSALVPVLCGIVVGVSWFAGCLAIVLPS